MSRLYENTADLAPPGRTDSKLSSLKPSVPSTGNVCILATCWVSSLLFTGEQVEDRDRRSLHLWSLHGEEKEATPRAFAPKRHGLRIGLARQGDYRTMSPGRCPWGRFCFGVTEHDSCTNDLLSLPKPPCIWPGRVSWRCEITIYVEISSPLGGWGGTGWGECWFMRVTSFSWEKRSLVLTSLMRNVALSPAHVEGEEGAI